ncbi:efflux transporter outer membrane subunit [Nitrospirillum viridazoti]|nr:efflux transporter outer membrane subunit [Nitrospirillum amazonense]
MRAYRTLLALSVCLLPLSGCITVGPDYQAPASPAAAGAAFTRAGIAPGSAAIKAADMLKAEEPLEEWWRQLGDPVLDQLVADAVKANLDLKAADAAVRAARAEAEAVGARNLPSLGASASYSRARAAAATQQGQPNAQLPDSNVTTAGGSLSWEIDLFGQVRRAIEAAEADSARAEALRHQVLTVIIADVASTYVDLRGAQLRLSVALRNAENQRGTFDLTHTLSDAGRGTDLDIARAQAQLETTLASIPPLRATVAADEHILATLTGREPGALLSLLDAPAPLPDLPDSVAVGTPATLLGRRADVAAAERALAAATARIGVATADLYPKISLTGSVGVQALQPGDLGARGAFTYGIGPSISLPLFDAALYARIREANANTDQAAANFQKAVLTAWQEAETALARYAQERSRRASLDTAAAASTRAASLAATRYRYGADNFLTVLDAQRTQLEAEDQLAQSRIQVAQDLVATYRALGGGWTVSRDVAPDMADAR